MRGRDINIDITRKCTLKCRHCYNHSGEMNNDELASDELFRIMNDLASTRPDNFCICGGEPLLKKEIIFRFIDHQKKINSEMNIGMVTNGELLTESISEKLIYYGLNNIQFSIDGATENSHDWLRNKKGLFENLLHTIMQLNILRRKAKSDIKISAVCCLNKRNYEELPKIIELCTRLGIDILRVQPLMKMGRAKEGLDAYSLSKNEYIQAANYLLVNRYKNIQKDGISIEWCDSLEHLFMEQLDFIQVNEKGELLLSPYIPIIIGDLKKHSISEYLKKNYGELWNHQLIRTFRKNIGSANEIILGKDFPAEVGMNYMKFDVFSEENMEQMNKCYAELIKSYGGQNVL